MSQPSWQSIAAQASLRRTFAIISHPDAGKTTLTEKLLLYSGLVRTAGMVRGRKGSKATSSDWMAMEQERGISITASAMQFPYKDAIINLLDTPGHQDFSEDTYRTLTAADCAVMVIDAAKGVEAQTRKLFEVCRIRGIPTMTFVNKMDLPARDIFDLLHEVETLLGVHAAPVNWPIGAGKNFMGVIERDTRKVSLFKRGGGAGGAQRALVEEQSLHEFENTFTEDPELVEKVRFELELLEEAGNPFRYEDFLAGRTSPVFFGSALTNFGVEPFFDAFVKLAPSPRAVTVDTPSGEAAVTPESEFFSAFVFKIQANMNPKHRDSMAFMRICSGCFERDMTVRHHRSKKEIRMARSYSMTGQDRNTVEEGYPGDIVGVINPGVFAIGDTISTSSGFEFKPMPQFPPEIIAQIRPMDVLRRKAFDKGVEQLCNEGAVQMLRSYENPNGSPYVAAVGRLQFDVLQFRLKEEYGVETALDVLPYRFSAWLIGDPKALKKSQSSFLTLDSRDRVVVLFTGEWEKNYLLEKNPEHGLKDFVN